MRGTLGWIVVALILPGCASIEPPGNRPNPSWNHASRFSSAGTHANRPSGRFSGDRSPGQRPPSASLLSTQNYRGQDEPPDDALDGRDGDSAEPEELAGAPPPLLFRSLRRWIQEDDPDGSEEGEGYEDRMKPRSDPAINIRHPDPDTANFPNSAFTIPQGRVYIENSPVSFYGKSAVSPKIYNWEFLFRYGITDRLEFRLFSNGLTNQYTSIQYPRGSPLSALNTKASVGFSPLTWDLKFHLWDEHKRSFLPAVGMEVYIETNMGSPAFSQGTQPSINLLFDHTLPLDFQFEWNAGIAGNLTVDDTIIYNFAFQWALQHPLFTDDLMVFTHGYLNNAALPRFAQSIVPGGGDIVVAGVGAQYALSDRLAVFGSYNWGLTPDSPQYFSALGFAFAL